MISMNFVKDYIDSVAFSQEAMEIQNMLFGS